MMNMRSVCKFCDSENMLCLDFSEKNIIFASKQNNFLILIELLHSSQ